MRSSYTQCISIATYHINLTPPLPLDRDRLFREAESADFDLDNAVATSDGDTKVAWLRGIPLAIKDLENAEGFPTTRGGCPLFGEHAEQEEDDGSYRFGNWSYPKEAEDEPFVRRLRDAGALIIGKTNGV